MGNRPLLPQVLVYSFTEKGCARIVYSGNRVEITSVKRNANIIRRGVS